MRSRLELKVILIFQLLVSALDSDILWPSNEDSPFSDTSLSLSQTSSFLDSIKFSESQEPLFEDLDSTIISPSSDIDGLTGSSFTNDVALDKSFELADCSPSESLSTIGTSRVRRLDLEESGSCKDTAAEPHPGGEDIFNERVDVLRGDPDILQKLTETMRNKAANTQCVFFTLSILPWGVCSSGWPPDEILLGETVAIPTRGVFSVYTLEYYKLGKLQSQSDDS